MPGAVEDHELDVVARLSRGLGVTLVRVAMDVRRADCEELAKAEPQPLTRGGLAPAVRELVGPTSSRRAINPLSSPRR